jgi:hypothetical protein
VTRENVGAGEPTHNVPGEGARLVIIRHPGPMDGLRTYSIFIDAFHVGDISEGAAKHFRISPGEHTLSVKLDFGRSRQLTIVADRNLPTEVHCRSRSYSPLRMVLNHKNYIELVLGGQSLSRQRSLKEEMKLRMLVLLAAVLVAGFIILPVSFAAGGHGPIVSIAVAVFLGLVAMWCAFGPSPSPRSGSAPDSYGMVDIER